MILEQLSTGSYGANCYIVGCEETREGLLVDPGDDAEKIMRKIDEVNLIIKHILLTHGHGDHIGALPEIKEKTGAPILIHYEDKSMLMDGNSNLSSIMSIGSVEVEPDQCLKDGDVIEFGKLRGKIIHTPGHTKGSICIKINNHILSGDTLFAGSIGRTDFPGGSFEAIISSIKNKILIHDDDTIIDPGHGPSTTIEIEKNSNPFINK